MTQVSPRAKFFSFYDRSASRTTARRRSRGRFTRPRFLSRDNKLAPIWRPSPAPSDASVSDRFAGKELDDYACSEIMAKRFVFMQYDCDRALSILMQSSIAIDNARFRKRYHVRFESAAIQMFDVHLDQVSCLNHLFEVSMSMHC